MSEEWEEDHVPPEWVLATTERLYKVTRAALDGVPMEERTRQLPAVAEAFRRQGVPLKSLEGEMVPGGIMLSFVLVTPMGSG